MTNSEVIRQLNSLIDNSKRFIDGDSDDIWERDIEALNIAKVSLQEKAEREKGCGHCRVDENNKTDEIVFENGNDLVEVQLCYGMLEIIYKTDGEVVFHLDADINYCPMCGRKLVEE